MKMQLIKNEVVEKYASDLPDFVKFVAEAWHIKAKKFVFVCSFETERQAKSYCFKMSKAKKCSHKCFLYFRIRE